MPFPVTREVAAAKGPEFSSEFQTWMLLPNFRCRSIVAVAEIVAAEKEPGLSSQVLRFFAVGLVIVDSVRCNSLEIA